jgi:hypothetical protein
MLMDMVFFVLCTDVRIEDTTPQHNIQCTMASLNNHQLKQVVWCYSLLPQAGEGWG